MKRDVVTVRDDEDVYSVARELSRQGVSGAPVVDAAGGVVGVISLTDLNRFFQQAGLKKEDFYRESEPDRLGEGRLPSVREWMTDELVSAGPETTLDELSRRMLKRGVHRILIMENGALVGVVTTMDILGTT